MTNADVLLNLLAAAINSKTPCGMGGDIDWRAVYRLAIEHRVEGLALSPALALPTPPPADLMAAWQERAMVVMLTQIQITDALHSLLAKLEEESIRAVVLKGVVLKALYPEPDMRVMSDADLLVAPESFEPGCEALRRNGFIEMADECHDDTFVCAHPDGLRVELHRRLFDRKRQGFLRALNESELFPASKAVRTEACGGSVWSLPPTEHALFQILHMAKHMITTGFGIRQVCDFALFAERYRDVIDWEWFRRQCERLSLSSFARAVFWICEERLGMPRASGVVGGDAMAGEALLEDVLAAGVFGKSSDERTRSAAVVYRAFDRTDVRSENRVKRLLAAVFIRADEMHAPYLYAKRRPWLLPAAWAHRLFRYIFLRDTNVMRETSEGMRIASERIELLTRLDMLR
jgi:hypothetical protein